MQTKLSNLIHGARRSRSGMATAGNGWTATADNDGTVTVRHYATDMLAVSAWGTLQPISRGYGSVSDKNKILQGIGSDASYNEIYA
jgi:hypothetical protein